MDKDNLNIGLLLARFNAETKPSTEQDTPQKLLIAMFFIAVGLILTAAGFVTLLLRLFRMVYLPILRLSQQVQFFRIANAKRLRRIKHSSV
jgi:hypothetical protein